MTAAKIAITLPADQLARIRNAVKSGRAESVSGYIQSALREQERGESLRALVADLVEQHGNPSAEDKAWASRVLKRKHKG